ncbi:Protein-tyrosine sulfotransferase [Coccomyxa sp. Obi]|nr:Protein-tyrosine sulfotransferase [Coccomyxa sp. Obi]
MAWVSLIVIISPLDTAALTKRPKRHSGESCEPIIAKYIADHSADHLVRDPAAAKTVFFLHIPRTAGRTYHACFLKLSTPPSNRCEKSYDVLRLNASIPACGLLGSHDDLSVLQYLPTETAVVTQLRDPVERILSAYEFAVEVAARAVYGRKAPKADQTRVSTRDVWPWELLVPWMEEDIKRRALENPTSSLSGQLDPYNNPLIMPLAEFVDAPIVEELLHNGASLQVLGITNYTHWKDTEQLRRCMFGGPKAQMQIQQLALQKLQDFAHVGVMERLEDSIRSLAAAMGLKMRGPAWKAAPDAFQVGPDGVLRQVKADEEYRHPVTLGQAYAQCVARARKKAAVRKASSFSLLKLPEGTGLEFTKQSRAAIDSAILDRIRIKNSVDTALWERGQELFAAKLEAQRKQGLLEKLPTIPGGQGPAHGADHAHPGEQRKRRFGDELKRTM